MVAWGFGNWCAGRGDEEVNGGVSLGQPRMLVEIQLREGGTDFVSLPYWVLLSPAFTQNFEAPGLMAQIQAVRMLLE